MTAYRATPRRQSSRPVRALLPHRSPLDWAARAGIAVALLCTAVVAVRFSIAQSVSRTNPTLAYWLASYDGRNAARLSFVGSQDAANVPVRRYAGQLARVAIAREPLSVVAFSTLGINSSFDRDTASANRLFGNAYTLSRRDLRTQLWMIESAVQRGDITEAVRQYDITLRVLPSAADLLYPVLTAAMADPGIRRPLVRAMAAHPIWTGSFIDYAATKGANPSVTALLFRELARSGITVPEAASVAVVDALIEHGDNDTAWAYYASLRGNRDRRRSRDPGFDRSPAFPSRFDWKVTEDGRSYTVINGGVANFSAPPGVGGPLLAQAQLLPIGTYVLRGRSSGVDQVEGARPYWTLRCADGRDLGRVDLPNDGGPADGKFAGRFSIPANCGNQTLLLIARPTDAISGLNGEIERAELGPAALGTREP